MEYFYRIYGGLSLAYFAALTLLPDWGDPVYSGLPTIIRYANWVMLALSIVIICIKAAVGHKSTFGEGVFLSSAVCSLPSVIGSLLCFDFIIHPTRIPYDINGGILERTMLYWVLYAWLEIIGIVICLMIRKMQNKGKILQIVL